MDQSNEDKKNEADQTSFQIFAEIEINGSGNKQSSRSVPLPQAVKPAMDKNRKTFNMMRQIAGDNQSRFVRYSKFYKNLVQHDSSKIFYKQAVFMKDFEDDFEEKVSFSAYFPYYQLMNDQQLRTYFTWRTKIRNGNITDISLSYGFLYIYELLNNIGVNDPQDGLDKLISFWNAFRAYDQTIDKYLIKWIKDYHIYYQLPKSFKEFVFENNVQAHYPNVPGYEPDSSNNVELLYSFSKYDIKKSVFFSGETCKLMNDCFYFVINRLRQVLKGGNIDFDDFIFQPAKNKTVWTPFQGALFFPWLDQPDRRVVLSEKEIYICSRNNWSVNAVTAMENGRQLISYIIKQMESALRKATKYKYKLTANQNMISNGVIQRLSEAGFSLETIINDGVLEFYKEITKTVVSVNAAALNKIRQEALGTQEKLIVPENEEQIFLAPVPPLPLHTDGPVLPPRGWTGLTNALDTVEITALTVVLQGGDMKQFADQNSVMLEVLADGINEKALDHIGDNILELDDGMRLYDEYREEIIKMVGR